MFNFPVPVKGEDVVEYPLENLTTAETVVLVSREKVNGYIDIDFDIEKLIKTEQRW